MRPATRELGLVLALIGLAGFLYFQRGENDRLRDAERQAVNAYRGARAQTDGALERIDVLRDSLARRGTRVDTVVRAVAGIADTLRLVVAASAHADSVTISKFEVLAWADKIDLAVNEVSKYRLQVDTLLARVQNAEKTIHVERAATDSLLAIKDRRIKASRTQGRKEGAVITGVLTVVVLILK